MADTAWAKFREVYKDSVYLDTELKVLWMWERRCGISSETRRRLVAFLLPACRSRLKTLVLDLTLGTDCKDGVKRGRLLDEGEYLL